MMSRFFIICLFMLGHAASAQVKVQHLRCEMLANPAGIDVREPRLSWQLESALRDVKQLSYQILVSSTRDKLRTNNGDVWNSGIINSDKSILVKYAGKSLESSSNYYWKVIVNTNKGNAVNTETGFFSTGILEADGWSAKWIGLDSAFAWDSVSQWSRLSARYLRKHFNLQKTVKKATIHISGLGLYELYINGSKTGDQVLAPAPTDYRKSVLYNTFDVTKQLQAGKNAIGVVLGNGRFFTMRQNYKPKKITTFGYPKLLLQLKVEFADGTTQTIVTDESWKITTDGPIRSNNEYDGEEFDANKILTGWNKNTFDDSKWMPVQLVEAPAGTLVAQMNEPMKVMRRIKPVAIKQLRPGVFVLDMGQNMTGWIKFTAGGKKGDTLTLRFAESLQQNGTLYTANLRDAHSTDKYIFSGTGIETWQPSFVFHGFRYVEVSGFKGMPTASNFEGCMVYDALETTGSFETSNDIINKIHTNAWWGIAGNYKGMPIDCPQRNERQPWLGDRAVGAQGESFLFENSRLYAKWLDDIEQSQTSEGALPDVAPAFWNYYSDIVTWPATYITVANNIYNQSGDIVPIEKHYASMKKWLWYIKGKYMKDHIITRDKYGDWCVPPESPELIHAKDSSRITGGPLLSTAYYFKLLSYMQRFAELLKLEQDKQQYALLSDSIRAAFQQQFYNPQQKHYANNTVTSNLLPLIFGITPDSLRAGVFEKIRYKLHVENHDHISTGVIGTQYLMRGLTEYGYEDLAFALAANKTYPGWGYMVENGATTIWELWNGNTADPSMNSQNHVMLLGDLLIWYYENLAGIRTNKTNVAYKKIIMKPVFPADLKYVKASYQSQHGIIKSHWQKDINHFTWDITIPANTTAQVYIPTSDTAIITEGAKAASSSTGVKFIKTDGKNTIYEIASGSYHFNVNYKWRAGIVTDEFIFKYASFPESHASTIAETPKGLVASWFGGTKEGNKDVCIWVSHLVNKQWTAPQKVADGILNDSTRYACYNPVLYQVPGGELLLFYKIGPNVAGWTGWMTRSKDDGYTWSPREALPDSFLGPIKNKPLMINGELVCPSSTEKNGWRVHFEMTPDLGKTWHKTGPINDGKTFSAIQPSILTYKDGSLQVLCRSKNQTINQSWSTDGGKSWSPMTAAALPNNNSGTDAVTLKDGRQLLVYNHVKPPGTLAKGPRTPLNVAVSDNGKDWKAALVLEDSPISQYSYPSVIQTSDGLVHFIYTWRRERIKHVVVDPLKLKLVPIVDAQWPGATDAGGRITDD